MATKQFIKDYFSFTKRERIAVLALVSLIVIVFLTPKFLPEAGRNIPALDTAWISQLKSSEIPKTSPNEREDLSNPSSFQYDPSLNYEGSGGATQLFIFDPNTASRKDWRRLGLQDKTINTIENYRNKGGRFKQPTDLKKIYGIRTPDYERLLPYISIKSSNENRTDHEKVINTESKTFTIRYQSVDINSADTSAFISLPGIGSKLAFRIVNFREKLGGFHSVEQVTEVYGLADSIFQRIKKYLTASNISVKKININTATVEELKSHPYIKWTLANPIVAYRNEHGLFTNTEDLKKIIVITEEIYQKLLPYLTL